MRNVIIEKLTSCGFKVSNAGIIYKQSTKHNSKEKAGVLNDFSVYFYAQNVAPFNPGLNTFKQILGNEYTYSKHTPLENFKATHVAKEITSSFSFEQYITTTKTKNHFTTYLKNQNKDVSSIYDIRGIKTGYLENATLFPYINYDNEFQTAKIVKYNSVTGKRIKGANTNNWFHAYKPIKNSLGLTGKVSKKITCFFGEHLVANNDKPIVIVEAEKTAIILSLIFKDIVFLATGGLNKLKTLDYWFLINRNVFLLPDNGAKEWFNIAAKRGWYISQILENKGTPGSDAADYLDTEIGNEIAAELNDIANNEIKYKVQGLNFSYKEKQSDRYCSTIYKGFELDYYTDMAFGLEYENVFKGANFAIYDKDFFCLSAGVDLNKWDYNNGKYVKPGADVFIERLEQCYRVLKTLNKDNDKVVTVFSKVLSHVLEKSNFLFNRDYITEHLVSLWNNDSNDVSEYIKKRNWRKINGSIKDKEFITFLNNDRKAHATNKLLKNLQPLLSKNQYIKPIDIGLTSKQSNEFIYNLIRDYNIKVLGCKTINNYKQKLKVNEYYNFVFNIAEHLQNNKTFQKFCTTYNYIHIYCKENETNFIKPPIQTVYDNTLVDKKIIREYVKFVPDGKVLDAVKTTVEYYIANPNDIDFVRVDKRIQIVSNITLHTMKDVLSATRSETNITNADAFNYEMNLTDSVLNVEQSIAMQKSDAFLYSWILFNNDNLSDYDKFNIKINPLQYLLNVDLKISA
tara:strand:- start:9 stop:2228 length:2220 start_codon:yes stop_codon:yes gene_type:complete